MKQATWVSFCLLGLTAGLAPAANEQAALDAASPAPHGSELKHDALPCLCGTIYPGAPQDQQVLFKFRRTANRFGSTLQVQYEFTYPDGRPAAREQMVFEQEALVSYTLEELQTGAVGSATLRRSPQNPAQSSIEFTYARKAGGQAKTRTESLAENTLVADMVGPFLAAHWEALGRGEKVKCRLIVVPHRQTVGFTFVKDSDCAWRGQEATVIRMEASSFLVATQVAPLFFTFEKAQPHRLLQYTGRTTPKVQADGKWKDLDAVMVFDWDAAGPSQMAGSGPRAVPGSSTLIR